MATETVPRLPAIKGVQPPDEPVEGETGNPQLPTRESVSKDDDDTRHRKAASFISRVKLGSVQKQPRPGDVYRPRTSAGLGQHSTAKQLRPLGLIPARRERMTLLTELTRMFSPAPVGLPAPAGLPAAATAPANMQLRQQTLPSILQAEKESFTLPTQAVEEYRLSSEETNIPTDDATIETTLKQNEDNLNEKGDAPKVSYYDQSVVGPSASTALLGTESLSPYRLHQYGRKEVGHQTMTENDPDYLEIFSKCNIKDYYGALENRSSIRVPQVPQKDGTLGAIYSRKRSHTLPFAKTLWSSSPKMTTVFQLSQSKKASHLSERAGFRSSDIEYVKFSGQAKLWNKSLTDDRRDALDYEPCERCRLRGGRCSKCKAIRTGGGYIILDGNDLSDEDLRRKYTNDLGYDDGYCYGHGTGRERGLNGHGEQGARDGASVGGSGAGLLTDGDSDHHLRGSTGLGRGNSRDRYGKGSKGRGTGGDTDRDGEGRDGRSGRSQDGRNALGDTLGAGDDDGNRGRDGSGNGLGLDGSTSADGLTLNGDQDDTGRYSNMSGRQSGSRPASTLGSRPGSSLRKLGSRGSSRRDRMRRNIGVEKRGRGNGEDSDGGGGSDGEGGGRRSRRRRRHGEGSDEEGDGKDRADFKFRSGGREGDGEEDGGSYANLMRFKRKRDDVKALHATMKELQGIDPLDYLARYCIIDQSKLPHYQHSYDNVDRDEDDEIDISELDFALKTVNYNLITDAEMNYVHSVLELAGRYKLNFRLFSLIAALSEKVVALEDMVKRHINKMDFEALEVKMKKCKELFYLLADDESSSHEGGVVTTSSLAVELQAGGLTAEHVDYVVNRLNHEDKGIVEFLDYLTYVPLFVEIHDNISGNPLDFSRTK